MGGSVVFYTYGSTLELNGQQFTAGMLTADLLNLSPDEYRPVSKRMKQVTSLAEEYEQSGSIELWCRCRGTPQCRPLLFCLQKFGWQSAATVPG